MQMNSKDVFWISCWKPFNFYYLESDKPKGQLHPLLFYSCPIGPDISIFYGFRPYSLLKKENKKISSLTLKISGQMDCGQKH